MDIVIGRSHHRLQLRFIARFNRVSAIFDLVPIRWSSTVMDGSNVGQYGRNASVQSGVDA